MIIKEFRIVLPMTVQEYQIGQLWTVAEFSKSETGGGDGVEVHVNEPFDQQRYCPEPSLLNDDPAYATGQYTKKTYHFKNRLTGILKLIPSSITSLSEEAWNAYPYCRTTISHPVYTNNWVQIESFHSEDLELENPHCLSEEELRLREIVWVDIADVCETDKNYVAEDDPRKFVSSKTKRGPLKPNWWKTDYTGPLMCAYKLVRIHCNIPLISSKLEAFIDRMEKKIFEETNRKQFCSIDRWIDMTMDDIRDLEARTKEELDKQRTVGSVRGHKQLD